MKLAFITPTAYLDKYATKGDFYLALAHLIDDNGQNEYASFHRREAEQGKRVILDNGLFEGAQVTAEQLILRAAAIKASVVCAPDVLFDSKGTIKEFKRFIRLKHEAGLVAEIMGIPQATNPNDWWECFQFMDLHPECNLIGLSILSVPRSFRTSARASDRQPITDSRTYLIRQLFAYSYLSEHRLTPMHMLGLGESYDDIKTAIRFMARDIISNDSSSAFVHGMKGIRYEDDGTIPGGKDHQKLNFNMAWSNHPLMIEHEAVEHNIQIAKEIARGIR